MLLVQAATVPSPDHVELVPHLCAHDPLRSHSALVLQATRAADSAAGRLYAEILANALAVHVIRRYAASRPSGREVPSGLSPAKLQRTIAYIQAHLDQELSLTTLAAVVHLSPDHFARLFRQSTGRPPHQYVLWYRIEHAKRLLAETDVPLSAIGLQIGCTDQSHFTALFRRHVGATPKAYRDATQRA
jgi:AraC family transcriptional regulator